MRPCVADARRVALRDAGSGRASGDSGRIYRGVAHENRDATGISLAEFTDITDHYSDPRRPGSPAAKLDALLRDPPRSGDLVHSAITMRVLRWQELHPGEPLTAAYVHAVAKKLKMELIFTRDLGIPASLYRAGLLYERARGQRQTAGEDTRGHEAEIWDEAIFSDRMRQMTDSRSLRTLPLHDGTSSSERSGARLSCGGLAEWDARIHGARANRYEGELDPDRTLGYDQPLPDDWTPDAKWFADHGITLERAKSLSDDQLRGAGIDPALFHAGVDAIAEPDGKGDAKKPHSPGKARLIDLVLQDPGASERIAARHPELSPDAALVREGMSLRLARTGLAFEKMMRKSPGADRQATWDAACAKLDAGARRRGAKSGPEGYMEYLHAVSDVIASVSESVDA